jgi:hypothetical protein
MIAWVLAALCLAPVALAQSPSTPPLQPAKPAVAKEKETVPGLYVTAKEAYEKWTAAGPAAAPRTGCCFPRAYSLAHGGTL